MLFREVGDILEKRFFSRSSHAKGGSAFGMTSE
jgi:hypothetical protein